MPSPSLSLVETGSNPLDVLEELVIQKDWPHERYSDEELIADVALEWCNLRLWCCWNEHLSALTLAASYETRIPPSHQQRLYPLLAIVNEKLLMGHFDIGVEEPIVSFRHTLPMRGLQQWPSEPLEDLLQVCIHECGRFYPALQSVLWGGKSAQDALQIALFDTAGEA